MGQGFGLVSIINILLPISYLQQYLYKIQIMTAQEHIHDNCPDTPANRGLQHYESTVKIPIPCVLCDDKIVEVQGIYDLLDFDDNGGINYCTVQFWTAYQTGFVVTIVVLELKTSELLKRSFRLDYDICDWVLLNLNYFNRMPESKEQLLFDSRDPD
jgi:hypothetical protein